MILKSFNPDQVDPDYRPLESPEFIDLFFLISDLTADPESDVFIKAEPFFIIITGFFFRGAGLGNKPEEFLQRCLCSDCN